MKKALAAGFAAIFATALLTGCGGKDPDKYDFSDTELSHAIGMSRKAADKLPDKNDTLSVERIYDFNVPHTDDSSDKDNVMMSFEDDKVVSVALCVARIKDDNEPTEHSICGIRARDNMEEAFKTAESYFGTQGRLIAPAGEFGVMDTYRFGGLDIEKGELDIDIDRNTGAVLSIALTVTPNSD